jgi:eukaryotic-like serine/threonine-protein kinase
MPREPPSGARSPKLLFETTMQRERWRVVEEVFQAALERKPDDRAAFLDEVCRYDIDLRHEVESLLIADVGASGFMEPGSGFAHLPHDTRGIDRSAPTAPDFALRLQAALGRSYTIESELGGGGMSRVFVAEETTLGRRVVIKVLAPVLAAGLDTERFHREIRIAASLQHPHVVPVHSAGEADGLLYYTMPFVQGESLRQRLERVGALPLAETVRLLRDITEALAYAHRHGIVHRDLKPANILLEEGHALVIDFGVAKALSAAAEGATEELSLTASGFVVGTPTYMAPEQAAANPGTDHRADLYSLGVLAYELLTGSAPFSGDTPQQLLAAHLVDQPESVIARRPEMPEDLAALVMQLLEKRPADRPDSAEQVLSILRALETSGPEGIAPMAQRKPLPRAQGKSSGSRAAQLGMTVLVVTTVVGVLFGRRLWLPEDPVRTERLMLAVLPFENLGRPQDEYFAGGLTDEITSRLAGVQRLGVISRTSTSQYKNTPKSLRQIGRELGVDYVLEGTVRWQGPGTVSGRLRVIPQLVRVSDDTHLWSERYDAEFANLLDVQASIAEQVTRALDVALAPPERQALTMRPTENMEAYAYYLRGNDYLAGSWGDEKRLRFALEMYERAVELDPRFAAAFARLSRVHSSIYRSTAEGTDEHLQKAKAAADTALRLQPDLAEAHLALGYYHSWGRKDYEQALQELLLAQRLQPNSSEVAEALGIVQRRRGRLHEAIAYLKRAAVLDPRSAEIASDIGMTSWFLRSYPEAEHYLNNAIALAPDWAAPYATKAWLYVSWHGHTDEAQNVVRAAAPKLGLGNLVGFLSPDAVFFLPQDAAHSAAFEQLSARDFEGDTALYALCKVEWYRLHGESRLARVYSDSARITLEAELRESGRLAWRRSFLGYAYAGLGRSAEAVVQGRRAVELVPSSVEPMQGPFAIFYLARIYAMVGDQEAAIDQLDHLLSIPSPVSVALLRVDPTWNQLRGSPRFQDLLERESSAARVETSDSF